MPRKCSICTHEERAEIESALVSGTAYRNVATAIVLATAYFGRPLNERVEAYVSWFMAHVPRGRNDAAVYQRFLRADEHIRERLQVYRTPVPNRVRESIIAECNHVCTYCGGGGDATHGPDGRTWHIDHMTPHALNGSDDRGNLTLACATCNHEKADQPLNQFLEQRRATK